MSDDRTMDQPYQPPRNRHQLLPVGKGMSRRQFTGLVAKTGAGLVAATVLPGCASRDAAETESPATGASETEFQSIAQGGKLPQPNILVIIADDMGWADLSCYGNPSYSTPNIDQIAASGVRFTDAYSQSAVCSPTRFALYTGRYPGRFAGGLPEPIPAPRPDWGIPIGTGTLASLLKGAGYDTAMMGKWHCGFLPDYSPTRLGWDSFFGNFGGSLDYFSKIDYASGEYDIYEGEVKTEGELRYYTDILSERGAEFVRRSGDRPWLLNLNFTAPHWPWEGPEDRAVSERLTAQRQAGDVYAGLNGDGGSVQKYGEIVGSLDKAVGAVMASLRDAGALDKTLIFFMSDNGGSRFSYLWPLDNIERPNLSQPHHLLEGAVRVPSILSWPGQIRPNQVSHAPVVTVDWGVTLLEIGGAKPDYPPDGTSLTGYLFRGEPFPEHDLFWRLNGQRALRRGNLKYLQQRDGQDQLYDLGVDPREQANLACLRPGDLASLRGAWETINATQLPYPDPEPVAPPNNPACPLSAPPEPPAE